jgi:hypothetical protein
MSMQDCVEVHLQVCSSFFHGQNGLHIRWFAQQPSGESNSHLLTAAHESTDQLTFFLLGPVDILALAACR